jgi:hypothetical protein
MGIFINPVVMLNAVMILYSARSGNLEVPVYFLAVKQGCIIRKIYTDKCLYEIREQIEEMVYWPIFSTDCTVTSGTVVNGTDQGYYIKYEDIKV